VIVVEMAASLFPCMTAVRRGNFYQRIAGILVGGFAAYVRALLAMLSLSLLFPE